MRSAFIIIVLQMSTVQTNKLVKHANFDIALKNCLMGHNWVHFAHIIV